MAEIERLDSLFLNLAQQSHVSIAEFNHLHHLTRG